MLGPDARAHAGAEAGYSLRGPGRYCYRDLPAPKFPGLAAPRAGGSRRSPCTCATVVGCCFGEKRTTGVGRPRPSRRRGGAGEGGRALQAEGSARKDIAAGAAVGGGVRGEGREAARQRSTMGLFATLGADGNSPQSPIALHPEQSPPSPHSPQSPGPPEYPTSESDGAATPSRRRRRSLEEVEHIANQLRAAEESYVGELCTLVDAFVEPRRPHADLAAAFTHLRRQLWRAAADMGPDAPPLPAYLARDIHRCSLHLCTRTYQSAGTSSSLATPLVAALFARSVPVHLYTLATSCALALH